MGIEKHTSILVCPVSKQSLRMLNLEELQHMNGRIGSGEMFYAGGAICDKPLEAGLMTEDGKIVYPVINGIFILFSHYAMFTDRAYLSTLGIDKLRYEKNMIMEFYNQEGWKTDDGETFKDAVIFEDLREVSREYLSHTTLRVNEYLPESGEYLLDCASGPVQYSDYLTFSQHFSYRICADISFEALMAAQKKLGEKGVYVLADITNLPFKSNTIDATISLHTVYHVPQDEQAQAVKELIRVTKPSSKVIVVYNFGWHSWLMNGLIFPVQVFRAFKRVFRLINRFINRKYFHTVKPTTYFYPHSPSWFQGQNWNAKMEIVAWRSVNTQFMQLYAHKGFGGKNVLSLVAKLEDRFPKVMGRIGYFPMLVFTKNR